MKHSKLILILFSLGLLVLPAIFVAAQDQTQVRISWWGSQNRHDRTIATIELYEELNPDIDIVYEFQGWATIGPSSRRRRPAANCRTSCSMTMRASKNGSPMVC